MRKIKGVEILYKSSGFGICRQGWCGKTGTYEFVWKEDGEEFSTCACLEHLNEAEEMVAERLGKLGEKVVFT